jgi:hypothetical protein
MAGVGRESGCLSRSYPGDGRTTFLENAGQLEVAQVIAGHADSSKPELLQPKFFQASCYKLQSCPRLNLIGKLRAAATQFKIN